MAYDLEEFCADCRNALTADDGDGGREEIRQNLEKLLSNPDFVAANCGPDAETGVHTLYHDDRALLERGLPARRLPRPQRVPAIGHPSSAGRDNPGAGFRAGGGTPSADHQSINYWRITTGE